MVWLNVCVRVCVCMLFWNVQNVKICNHKIELKRYSEWTSQHDGRAELEQRNAKWFMYDRLISNAMKCVVHGNSIDSNSTGKCASEFLSWNISFHNAKWNLINQNGAIYCFQNENLIAKKHFILKSHFNLATNQQAAVTEVAKCDFLCALNYPHFSKSVWCWNRFYSI